MFRYCVNATYGFYSPVTVQGFNSYGGGFGTEGRVDSGIGDHSDCPGEYSLTQHLVLAPDIRFQTINATHFSGTTGVGLNGESAIVGKGGNLLTIAPAVEYNFNQHIGLIALFDEQSGTGATTLAVVKKMRLPSWDAGFHIGVFAHDVGHFPSKLQRHRAKDELPPSVRPVKPTLSTSRWAASAAPAVSTFMMVLLFDTSVRVWT